MDKGDGSQTHALSMHTCEKDTFVSRIRQLGSQARAYGALMAWLCRDLIQHYRWRAALIVLTGGLAVAAKYGATGVLYAFVQHFESNELAAVLGLELPAPRSVDFLVIGVAAVAILLMLSAYLRFQQRTKAIRIGQEYEEVCLRRLISAVGHLPHPRATFANQELASGSVAKYAGYARQAGMLAWILGQNLMALFSVLAAGAILLWIDYGLTLGLAGLAIPVFLAQFPANRNAARASNAFEDHIQQANLDIRNLIMDLQTSPIPISSDRSQILDRFFNVDSMRRSQKGHGNRFRSIEQAALVSELGGTVMLGGTVLALGYGVINGYSTLAYAATYVAVMRYLVRDLVRVSRMMASINRFYAPLDRYRRFMLSTSFHDSVGQAHVGAWASIHLTVPRYEHSNNEDLLSSSAGQYYAVLSPPGRIRPLSAILADAIKEPVALGSRPPFEARDKFLDPCVAVRENLGLPPAFSEEFLAKKLSSFAPPGDGELKLPRSWCDRKPTPKCENKPLPSWAVLALNVIAARLRAHDVIIINASDLTRASENWRTAFFSECRDAHVFIAHDSPQSVGQFGETAVIICGRMSAQFCLPSPRTAEERAQLARALEEARQASLPAAGGAGNSPTEIAADA